MCHTACSCDIGLVLNTFQTNPYVVRTNGKQAMFILPTGKRTYLEWVFNTVQSLIDVFTLPLIQHLNVDLFLHSSAPIIAHLR